MRFSNDRKYKIRTCDLCVPNAALYQAELISERVTLQNKRSSFSRSLPRHKVMHPAGVEPATFWFVVRHSIQLRYGCKKAEDGIRTRDPHHGKVMFYHWTTSALSI